MPVNSKIKGQIEEQAKIGFLETCRLRRETELDGGEADYDVLAIAIAFICPSVLPLCSAGHVVFSLSSRHVQSKCAKYTEKRKSQKSIATCQ